MKRIIIAVLSLSLLIASCKSTDYRRNCKGWHPDMWKSKVITKNSRI